MPLTTTKRFPLCFALEILIVTAICCPALVAQAGGGPTTVRFDLHHDVSPPLREMIRNAVPGAHEEREAEPARRIPLPLGLNPAFHDAALQQSTTGFSPQLGPELRRPGQRPI